MIRPIQCLLALLALTVALHGAEPVALRWLVQSNRVDAALHGVALPRVLAKIARATGWQIFLEPGTHRDISATFTNLPPRAALGRLLGSLSFVHVPQNQAAGRLLIYRSSAEAATEAIEAGGADDYALEMGPIPNELIVRLKPGAKLSPESLAKMLGATLVGRMDDLNAYRLRFETPEAANAAREELQRRTDVAGVESNFRLPPPEPNQPGGQTSPRLTLKPRATGDGKTITVGLVDTLLQPQPKEFEQFITQRLSVVEGKFVVDNTQPMHATPMLQAILQAAASVSSGEAEIGMTVLSVNVYGPTQPGEQPSTTSWDVALGIKAAWENGANPINLSLGGDNDSPLLDDLIGQVTQQGAIVFAATGNKKGRNLTFPSASPGATGVTAVDANGQPAAWANVGPQARLAGPSSTLFQFGAQTWVATGTSGATAWISGLAAGAMSAKGWTPAQTEQWLAQQKGFKH